MKALILAAGLGSRLAPITDKIPKSLVKVNGTPILFKQIDNLIDNGILDITVISGYKGDYLKDKVQEKYPFVKIIHSENYNKTNNMYSSFLGKDSVLGSDFLLMNADVFHDSSVISALLKNSAPNAIVVDINRYNEESMKVTGKIEQIESISKQIPKENALGTSIDIYKFSSIAGEKFFDRCSYYINTMEQFTLWSEVALNDVLKEINFAACPLEGRWFEIDNHDDLAEAEKLFMEV